VRDYGAIFVVNPANGTHAALDFGFDAWGGKYPPWDRDDAVPKQMAAARGVRCFSAGFVLEGGSVDGDGAGTILTTESCLLNPNRGPVRTRELLEARLANMFGAQTVIWLEDGIARDDTNGHIDDFARFVAPGRVVVATEDDASDANHVPLRDARARLATARDASGRALDVIDLPMPRPRRFRDQRLPASYANFYIANGVILMPSFEEPNDARAASILEESCDGRRVIPISCGELVIGLGGVHCLTQQEPL
jgi:agmatine deiminase